VSNGCINNYCITHYISIVYSIEPNDYIFPAEGAEPYKQDLQNIEFHLLDTGHFALEEEGDAIAAHIRRFIPAHIS